MNINDNLTKSSKSSSGIIGKCQHINRYYKLRIRIWSEAGKRLKHSL